MSRLRDADHLRSNNLVMNMKNKFECNEATHLQEPKIVHTTKTLPNLSRQLSDPVKVKRTPAFRCEQKPFQRGHATSCREKKTILRVSDKPSSVHALRKQFDMKDNSQHQQHIVPMALKERSNSSAEIILNNRLKNHEYENITALYTEPIPKNQRPSNAIHNMSTLKLTDKTDVLKNVQNNTRIKDDINYKLEALTDTLKMALKKPLPTGPAPQKPPRTFKHQSNSSSPVASKISSPETINSRISRKEFAAKLSVNLQKNFKQKIQSSSNTLASTNSASTASTSTNSRPDPKYMLEKLENALKTNRIRKISRSSSEDRRRGDRKENTMETSTPLGKINLNCLHSLSCTNNAYERLPELATKSPVRRADEPLYAEPFAFLKAHPEATHQDKRQIFARNGKNESAGTKSNRNSLYYMSTPIATDSPVGPQRSHDVDEEPHEFPRKMASLELPLPTDDDIDSPSSHSSMDESSPNIKELIKTFEGNNSAHCPASTDRVDELGKQLRRTLEQSFNDSPTTNNIASLQNNATINNNIRLRDKEDTRNEAFLGKFETYVRTIRLITKQSKKKFEQRQMFHCCMLVTLCDKVPFIKFNYPPNASLPSSIAELCFPDSDSFDSSPKAQTYSIVLTQADGERIYGYCRRVLPEDSPNCLPLAYCILSKNRAHRFYNRILEEIESRHGLPDKDRDVLLQAFYGKRFPSPGESISFNIKLSQDRRTNHYALVNGGTRSPENSNTEYIEVMLHQDARHKENDLEELCNCLDTNLLNKVFASLLIERKVILLSNQLGRLSTCIEALQNILYPFSWPHTLIPVLPQNLWEIVEAPTPLICGALSSMVLNDHDITDGIVIDLDMGSILLEVGDELNIIPNCLWKEFKDGLALAKSKRKEASTEHKSVSNVLISDAFLRIFVHSCGHYKEFLIENRFDLDGFVQHPKKKAVRRFLKWFTQTSMFAAFTDNIIVDKNYYKIFEGRTHIYRAQDAPVILDKMKEWRKD